MEPPRREECPDTEVVVIGEYLKLENENIWSFPIGTLGKCDVNIANVHVPPENFAFMECNYGCKAAASGGGELSLFKSERGGFPRKSSERVERLRNCVKGFSKIPLLGFLCRALKHRFSYRKHTPENMFVTELDDSPHFD